MLSLSMTAAGLILSALAFLMKVSYEIRKEAIEATKERAELQSQVQLVLYRLTRIEHYLDASGDSP